MAMSACLNVSANYGLCVDLQGPGLSMNMGGARQSVTSAGYFLQQCFIFGQPKGPLCFASLDVNECWVQESNW